MTPKLRLTTEENSLLRIHRRLPLQIELIPISCWFSNLKKLLKKSSWDRIRFQVYSKARCECEICGKVSDTFPACHEVWTYDHKNRVQKLKTFMALCPDCHFVKHLGLARMFGVYDQAVKRFCRINNMTRRDAKPIIAVVFKQWRIRNSSKWKLNVECLRKYGIDPRNRDIWQSSRKRVPLEWPATSHNKPIHIRSSRGGSKPGRIDIYDDTNPKYE